MQFIFLFLLVHNSEILENLIKSYCTRHLFRHFRLFDFFRLFPHTCCHALTHLNIQLKFLILISFWLKVSFYKENCKLMFFWENFEIWFWFWFFFFFFQFAGRTPGTRPESVARLLCPNPRHQLYIHLHRRPWKYVQIFTFLS